GRYFHTFFSVGGDKPAEFFGLSPDKNHKPNRTRIAFWADTREEVDRIAKLVRDAGGKNLEGPGLCKGYHPGYYAFFFEDADGNNREFCGGERRIFAVYPGGAPGPGGTMGFFAGATPAATLGKWPI